MHLRPGGRTISPHERGMERPRSNKGREVLIAFGVAVTVAGCASAPRPYSLRTRTLTAKPVMRLAWIDNYPRAVATITYILEHELAIPPVDASLRFYQSRDGLANALVGAGYDPVAARRVTASVGALAADGKIILNDSVLLRRPWTQRIAVIAHELTHSVQYQLAENRRGTSAQWLREGFSEYMAIRVLERLDVTSVSKARYVRMRHVRNAGRLPPLNALANGDEWLRLNGHLDQVMVYPYAFLAVDLLVQQHGLSKVLDYFRLFAFTDDREWAFREAFGSDVTAFERKLRERIHPSGRRQHAARQND
jgi:hypothetical protein